MAEEERAEEEPRRARQARREPPPASRPRRRSAADQKDTDRPRRRAQPDDSDSTPPTPSRNGHKTSAGGAARRAAEQVAALTGHDAETVISIEPCDDGWQIGVEVVETHRIPDSADILASYEVRLEADGELVSYRRTRRYARGQLRGEGR